MELTKMDQSWKGEQHITRKKAFKPTAEFSHNVLVKTLNFSYQMSFENRGEHRHYRSGGSHVRKNGEIFANTFQGKLSEFAVHTALSSLYNIKEPDLSTYGLGEWDDADLEVLGKKIAIKSTKSFGNLLLLEKKDWDDQGRYIPNITKGTSQYDAFVLVRINPYCEEIFKRNAILYSNSLSKEKIEDIIYNLVWEYEITGFCTRYDVIHAINNGQLINRGELLNGKIKMDASNYYIQSGDLNSMNQFSNLFK